MACSKPAQPEWTPPPPEPTYRADIQRRGVEIVLENVGTGAWVRPVVEVNYKYKNRTPAETVPPGARLVFKPQDLVDWEGNHAKEDLPISVLEVRTVATLIRVLP